MFFIPVRLHSFALSNQIFIVSFYHDSMKDLTKTLDLAYKEGEIN